MYSIGTLGKHKNGDYRQKRENIETYSYSFTMSPNGVRKSFWRAIWQHDSSNADTFRGLAKLGGFLGLDISPICDYP